MNFASSTWWSLLIVARVYVLDLMLITLLLWFSTLTPMTAFLLVGYLIQRVILSWVIGGMVATPLAPDNNKTGDVFGVIICRVCNRHEVGIKIDGAHESSFGLCHACAHVLAAPARD